MKFSVPSPAWPAAGRHPAFTLAELLVGLGLSLILFASILAWMTSYERSRSLLDSQLRLQDRWRRVHALVAADLQESRLITGNPPMPCTEGSTVLAMQYSSSSPLLSDMIYRYYLVGASPAELWRCGPLSLDPTFGSTELAFLSSDGQGVLNVRVATGVQSISLDLTDPQRPTFRLALIDQFGYAYSNNSAVSSIAIRSRVIGD